MKHLLNYAIMPIALLSVAFFLTACDDDDPDLLADPVTKLSNDCIKRSLPYAPNIVGESIEFAYGMAIPKDLGTLTSAQAECSIAGAEGTYFDPNSYYTNSSGQDIPVPVCSESQTSGTTTTITFNVDTCAATLRYYYIIPEEARGKEINFVFSVKASNGQTAEYKMGPYKISTMDMTTNLSVSNENCYITFHNEGEAIHVYSASEIEANSSLASKVDIMYHYSTKGDLSHAFYAATAPSQYMDDTTIPSGFTSDTKIMKIYGLRDRQLADLQYSHFIDDLDFEEIDMSRSTNYALLLKTEGGTWIETADGLYRAFIYINSTSTGSMTISAKRYKME